MGGGGAEGAQVPPPPMLKDGGGLSLLTFQMCIHFTVAAVFIQRNGTVKWNGMWNGMATPT